MAQKSRTNTFLIILGVVSAAVLGYLIWSFLSPPLAVAPVSQSVPTEVQSSLINSPSFDRLQPFATLPIIATNVGRVDPFAPFPLPNANANTNVNDNVNGSIVPQNVNVQ